jgi:hypothetical protein
VKIKSVEDALNWADIRMREYEDTDGDVIEILAAEVRRLSNPLPPKESGLPPSMTPNTFTGSDSG